MLHSCRFNGMPLQTLIASMRGIERLRQYMATEVFPSLDPVIAVYGEFMCSGTATSKSCKFDYEARGYSPGNFYAFGLTVYFDGAGNGSDEMEDARSLMADKTGLVVLRREDPGGGLLCHLSRKLSQLFSRFGLRFAWIIDYFAVIISPLNASSFSPVGHCHFKKWRSSTCSPHSSSYFRPITWWRAL